MVYYLQRKENPKLTIRDKIGGGFVLRNVNNGTEGKFPMFKDYLFWTVFIISFIILCFYNYIINDYLNFITFIYKILVLYLGFLLVFLDINFLVNIVRLMVVILLLRLYLFYY